MSSWRELAAQRVGAAPLAPPEPTIAGVKGELARNLMTLEHMAPPRGADRAAWAATVRDALRIAREGWAESALPLGWSELDLFGIGPRDSWEFSGLAAWLQGRSLVMLDERIALASDTHGNRATFIRGGWGHGKDEGLGDPVPLWRFGRR